MKFLLILLGTITLHADFITPVLQWSGDSHIAGAFGQSSVSNSDDGFVFAIQATNSLVPMTEAFRQFQVTIGGPFVFSLALHFSAEGAECSHGSCYETPSWQFSNNALDLPSITRSGSPVPNGFWTASYDGTESATVDLAPGFYTLTDSFSAQVSSLPIYTVGAAITLGIVPDPPLPTPEPSWIAALMALGLLTTVVFSRRRRES